VKRSGEEGSEERECPELLVSVLTSGSRKIRSLVRIRPIMSCLSTPYTGMREYPDLNISDKVCMRVESNQIESNRIK
jgi:hypothetical protein